MENLLNFLNGKAKGFVFPVLNIRGTMLMSQILFIGKTALKRAHFFQYKSFPDLFYPHPILVSS